MIGAKGKSGPATASHIVYVSNLKFAANEQDLLDLLKQHQFEPVRARLLYDGEGNSKGTGFVELKSAADAASAVEKLHGEHYQGRKLNVSLSTK